MPYVVVGILLVGLLAASVKTNASLIWIQPFVALAFSHALLIDAILNGLSIHWGSIDFWLLATYVAVGVTAAVASEKIAPPPSPSARWLRALIVWLIAFGSLTLITLALGWLGILTV